MSYLLSIVLCLSAVVLYVLLLLIPYISQQI